MIKSGIYQIRNKINGKIYIGSSADKKGILQRWKQHVKDLKNNIHHNKHLQTAWKYAEEI